MRENEWIGFFPKYGRRVFNDEERMRREFETVHEADLDAMWWKDRKGGTVHAVVWLDKTGFLGARPRMAEFAGPSLAAVKRLLGRFGMRSQIKTPEIKVT